MWSPDAAGADIEMSGLDLEGYVRVTLADTEGPPSNATAVKFAELNSGRTFLQFTRYNWPEVAQWLREQEELELLFCESTPPMDCSDVMRLGVAVLRKV